MFRVVWASKAWVDSLPRLAPSGPTSSGSITITSGNSGSNGNHPDDGPSIPTTRAGRGEDKGGGGAREAGCTNLVLFTSPEPTGEAVNIEIALGGGVAGLGQAIVLERGLYSTLVILLLPSPVPILVLVVVPVTSISGHPALSQQVADACLMRVFWAVTGIEQRLGLLSSE